MIHRNAGGRALPLSHPDRFSNRIRQYDGADIAPDHHNPATLSDAPLLLA
jgi:hypothetical protein